MVSDNVLARESVRASLLADVQLTADEWLRLSPMEQADALLIDGVTVEIHYQHYRWLPSFDIAMMDALHRNPGVSRETCAALIYLSISYLADAPGFHGLPSWFADVREAVSY